MKAIPTKYQCRLYRSRLEARWAAFFKLLGWHAEYEPIDFNGWIPDFVLTEAETVYVEVKPVDRFPLEIADEIDKSNCDKEVLIVGMTVPLQGELIGWLREDVRRFIEKPAFSNLDWTWAGAALGVWRGTETEEAPGKIIIGNPDNILGFCHEEQSFRDRITGFYDGGCFGQGSLDIAQIRSLWAQAGNEVQWKGPQ